ncbi:class I SAM-dependent methyltransferase [Kamptonema sp. UHCC 0994]|uniref:class I SAM-dependent methyltransferase n=1 Tax=Kamptonema sp. UHCC 0994 TaxID=3031329 RepID=UPI0023B8A400|nr:class I SAM-dependent methyltransferase [Kamptonema sp. UHCC 0994]MDF0552920.1 class I SAM-dependent methyltransferase [Kamptonema sp. UHCC 0994]
MTVQQLDINDSNLELCDLIFQRIATSSDRQITFAEYMDLALYHPQHGYYTTNEVNIGKHGDFFTSPHLGSDFGEVLAEQFVQMWEILAKPNSFIIVEMGAGQGILAADILAYLQRQYPDFFQVLEYLIIEKSAVLKAEQQQRLTEIKSVRWCNWDEIPTGSIAGCFFSNELVDALPIHQIVVEKGQVKEVYVTAETQVQEDGKIERKFAEVIGEVSTTKISEYFNLVGIDLSASAYTDGYRSEVNLAALDWIATVAEKLQRGYLLTIDYGYPAHRYYNPNRREGTLQCYYHHQHHNHPYLYVGKQDLTSHVDFTALEQQGELYGLELVGLTQQGLFLMALGLGDRIAALSSNDAQVLDLAAFLRRREALHQLIDPMGLGGFGVLVQSKGLSEEERGCKLKGFIVPE